jgi:hypothetical protein
MTKVVSAAILFFALGANAFSLRSVISGKVAKILERENEIFELKIFDDVGLSKEMGLVDKAKNLLQFSKVTNKDVVDFVTGKKGPVAEIKALPGKVKIDPDMVTERKMRTLMINDVIKEHVNDPDPVDGYMYFGNKNFKKNLGMLLKVNPFFASALTVSDDDEYLELIAYSPEPKSATDSKYLTYTRELKKGRTDVSHRINVRFNTDMTVNKITKFDIDGKAEIVKEADWDYYASGAIYNLFCFASSWHTVIHVLHYLMTAAIIHVTRHNPSLAAWANPYDDNISIKYSEVAALLLDSNLKSGPSMIVSGEDGLGANPAIIPELRKMLCTWGACKDKDDYMKTFLLQDLYATTKNPEKVIEKFGLLTEFTKHIDNVKPFGDELAAAMRADNEKDFVICEDKLKKFMSNTGKDVSSIDSISSWVQLMCCTGMTHGSTLSYSRMVFVPEIMRWRNIANPLWDAGDAAVIQGTGGTIAGMTVDRHAFTSEIKNGFVWNTDPIAKIVKDVLKKYDDKAETLKKDYQKDIVKRDDFRDYGWILTDHCVDGYDGKQHTMTTYI